MKWGKQFFYCNNCGRRLYIAHESLHGRAFKVCPDIKCVREMELKIARSTLGEDEPLNEALGPEDGDTEPS
jgi:hypothetical protein